ncbi:MAG: hypothetical protein ACT4TC_23120 [Myxococcaceae bacterium]
MRTILLLGGCLTVLAVGCAGESDAEEGGFAPLLGTDAGAGAPTQVPSTPGVMESPTAPSPGQTPGESVVPDAGSTPTGPQVDRSNPQLTSLQFTAKQADAAATKSLGEQIATIDTRVVPAGLLVVYLHGSGAQTTCGNREMFTALVGMGFHVLGPCYFTKYSVSACGEAIRACRQEVALRRVARAYSRGPQGRRSADQPTPGPAFSEGASSRLASRNN